MTEKEPMMHAPNNNGAVADAMIDRRDRSQTLEAQFLQYADAHRAHYIALVDLQAKVSESLETLNQERGELFKALRARAEALDDGGREIVAPLMEGET
jgi:hypothetical protein